ncbi:uncharacterized protein TM35_000022680 [Trypanosoma theileri]|uniref:BRCT domain-containing protein n=1 Tax=Trypanosoma theileri TaxID=67003 RepID=A0A1X0P7M9_9TRYP|nr:uncharacterized protein TM35_000022680 [Trypanosoma theileri]ORC92942.1 hypothetical protein TM35_000022680 [Trypanosoma theileri]
MFRGHVFLAASNVPKDVQALVLACGGRVVSRLEATVTFGLVAAASLNEIGGTLSDEEKLRGLRIPIVRSSWIRASVAAGHMVPVKYPHAVYDPELFASFHFTTVWLPTSLEKNVIAVMQFFGGTYSPQLTATTNILVYGDTSSHCGEGIARETAAAVSTESEMREIWRRAMESAIPCVSVEWLHNCIISQQLHPLPQQPLKDVSMDLNSTITSAAAVAVVSGDCENSGGSLQDAATNSRMDLSMEGKRSPQRCRDNRYSKADVHSLFTPLISLSDLCEAVLDTE